MTPNEKLVLKEFAKVKGANAVAMAPKLGLSNDYAQYLCTGLAEKGYLEIMKAEGKFPMYKITDKGKAAVK